MREPKKSAPRKRKENLGQNRTDTQPSHAEIAAAGHVSVDPHYRAAGGGSHKANFGQPSGDIQRPTAETATADHDGGDIQAAPVGGGHHHQLCDDIRSKCRWRRFWMKTQHKLDRALESQIRRTETNWSPELSEAERAKCNKEALAIIAKARKGEGNPEIIAAVLTLDEARGPADKMEAKYKKEAERLAMQLQIYQWIESIPGAGAGGLATIIGETGSLSLYSSCAKVWKRLGYAPYDGFAGSTWKRDSWRPRNLTSEEWIENPFSGARYALMYSIADSMLRKQKEGRDKELEEQQKGGLIPKDACLYRSGQKYGEPKGSFGEVYVKRRLRTDETHPEWSAGHSHSDALRIMMKSFLKKVWKEWCRIEHETPEQTKFALAEKPRQAVSAEGAGRATSGMAERPRSRVPVPQLSPEQTPCAVAEKPESHLSANGSGAGQPGVSEKTMGALPVPQASPEQTIPGVAEKPNAAMST